MLPDVIYCLCWTIRNDNDLLLETLCFNSPLMFFTNKHAAMAALRSKMHTYRCNNLEHVLGEHAVGIAIYQRVVGQPIYRPIDACTQLIVEDNFEDADGPPIISKIGLRTLNHAHELPNQTGTPAFSDIIAREISGKFGIVELPADVLFFYAEQGTLFDESPIGNIDVGVSFVHVGKPSVDFPHAIQSRYVYTTFPIATGVEIFPAPVF